MTGTTRVLVADDDATALIWMRAALENAGFEVETAASGDEALAKFRQRASDMVLLDVEMPGRNGHEVCAALRAEAGDLLPIVMVTGMDDVRSVEKAYDAGATDFIAKPINWALLGHRLMYLQRAHQAMLDLRAAKAETVAILNAVPDLLFETDADGRFVDYHSPRSAMISVPASQVIGRTIDELLAVPAAAAVRDALLAAEAQGTSTGRQFELQLPEGNFWFELSVARKETPAGEKSRFIFLARDITERRSAEERIRRLAYFDALTDLPNRQSFVERVDAEIAACRRRGARLGVIFMDLDGFKNVNDSLGHAVGDHCLQLAADRLRQGLRPSDALARSHPEEAGREAGLELARLGGDEFTVLIPGIESPEDARAVAARLRDLMRRPFLLEGREVQLSASIGISIYPGDGTDANALLKHADTAMYQAKALGRDNFQFYSESLTQRAVRRLNLATSLRRALERSEFALLYQPQYDLAQGRITSVEALIRWHHPEEGMVAPQDFIPLAEETGLIVPIGEWVLRTACADGAVWMAAGLDLRVAVNLSPLQFRNPQLAQSTRDALAQSGLPAQRLELEVTEGAVMEDDGQTIGTLEALRSAGVRVALDDFGTGYSSMSYLKRMPLSTIKIDRSFVSGLPDNAEDHAIVRAILSMAKSLGFRVTAEGVETAEQARTLVELACDNLQGYYFSRPVPAAEIPELVARTWLIGRPIPVKAAR